MINNLKYKQNLLVEIIPWVKDKRICLCTPINEIIMSLNDKMIKLISKEINNFDNKKVA
jgi:hypothetical protein